MVYLTNLSKAYIGIVLILHSLASAIKLVGNLFANKTIFYEKPILKNSAKKLNNAAISRKPTLGEGIVRVGVRTPRHLVI